jgi:hypothetical protein
MVNIHVHEVGARSASRPDERGRTGDGPSSRVARKDGGMLVYWPR